MTLAGAWRKEAVLALAWLAVAAITGALLGRLFEALFLAVLVYLAWHLANAVLLYRRLHGATFTLAPQGFGLWGDIQRELTRLEQTRRDFVGNASHELRTPLTVLRGYLDMIHEDAVAGRDLKTWKEPLGDMRQQTVRMEDIVNDMLTLARLESEGTRAEWEEVDVPGLLGRIARQADSLSSGRHHIRLDVTPGLRLRGQPNELQSVFSNLVINAVRHTPPGSKIVVSWVPAGEGARFSVSDNGPGIPAKDIPRLTERFYRVDVGRSRASGGTGLGLAIVKHALERHESRLEIESAVGAGATFICLFPPRRTIPPAATSA